MELWRYYRIIRQRRWLILACVVVCVGTVFAVTKYFTPQMYTGRTRVMERQPGPEQGVQVYGDRYAMTPNLEIHLADLGTICASSQVMQRTANTLQALNISLDPIELLKTVHVEPVPQTEILQIDVTSPKPEEAKAGADVIAAEFRKFYDEVVHGATAQSREFIEKQLADAKNELSKAQDELRRYKEQNQIDDSAAVQLDQQSQILLQRLAEIKSQELAARANMQEAIARSKISDEQQKDREEMRETQRTTSENPIWQSLVSQRAKLESDLAGLQVHKGPKHPDVMAVTQQLAEVNEQIKKQQEMIISQVGTSLDPIKTSALGRYLTAKADESAAEARAGALESAVKELQPQLQKLPKQEMEITKRQLDVKTAQDTYALLRSKLDEAKIKEKESVNASSIKIIEPAYVFPVDPKLGLKLMLALILSPMLGIGLAFFLNYLDNTVKTPAEAEELLGLPVFTVIPLGRNHSLVRRPDSPALSATYQMLSTQLWQTVRETGKSTVAIASAEPDAGRSATAANLAVTLAADGARVILVDADMRKPSLHLMFGVDNKRGFSNLLGGTATIEDTAIPTKFEGLLLIPAGPTPDNPVRLLRQPQMQSFVEQIGSLADFVIFDTPAGITFADASLVAAYAHNVVLVHSAGKVPRGAETEFRTMLDQVDANVVGVVLNRVRPEDSHGYFHYKRAYQEILPPGRGKGSGVKAILGASIDDEASN